MNNKEKREKCFKYGLPILSGLVFGTGLCYITKTILGFVFVVGFFCGSYIYITGFGKEVNQK